MSRIELLVPSPPETCSPISVNCFVFAALKPKSLVSSGLFFLSPPTLPQPIHLQCSLPSQSSITPVPTQPLLPPCFHTWPSQSVLNRKPVFSVNQKSDHAPRLLDISHRTHVTLKVKSHTLIICPIYAFLCHQIQLISPTSPSWPCILPQTHEAASSCRQHLSLRHLHGSFCHCPHVPLIFSWSLSMRSLLPAADAPTSPSPWTAEWTWASHPISQVLYKMRTQLYLRLTWRNKRDNGCVDILWTTNL